MSLPEFPANTPADVRKQMLRFVRFKMRDGSVQKIRARYIPEFANEAMSHEKGKPLSKGAWVMLNAVADDGTIGRMLELIHLVKGPASLGAKCFTASKEQTFGELHDALQGVPASETGE